MGKNIVVFSDGTGQEGGVGNNTNVYDLFNMIEDRTERQVSFYDRGLGTGWRKITGNIGGRGISQNIQDCYAFISDCYKAGDQIYLFGFSRGAYTVRTLAGFIDLFGILPKSRPELIKRAYKIYKTSNKEKRRKRANEFLQRNHTMRCDIRFLGVWDTVGALGLPIKILDVLIDQIPFWGHSFHDVRLSKRVNFARHALAIDDERKIFHPTLWDETEEREEIRQKIQLPDDITDIYLVATKLKAAVDPVSNRLIERSLTFSVADSQKLESLVPKLRNAGKNKDRVSQFVAAQFSREEREFVSKDDRASHAPRMNAVRECLNRIICGKSIYDEERFKGIKLGRRTRELSELRNPRRDQIAHLNRLLLEDAYDEIPKAETQKLIDDFDRDGLRQESPVRIQELKKALQKEFNEAIEGDPLYDPDHEVLFPGMNWSDETHNQMNLKDKDAAAVRTLNRLILEDVYSLRPTKPPWIKQVWFAGMHTDVGGGYAENELARIPMLWMVKEAIDVGLQIYEKHKVDLRPDAAGKMHNSRGTFLGRLYKPESRCWDVNKNQGRSPLVHESVLIRSNTEECAYEPWILKMKKDLEPWPKRLRSSVQFDDYFIWREGMWGWGSAFAVPWNSVERVSYDEHHKMIMLEIKNKKDPIEIKGSLSRGIRELLSAFDRRRLQRENERQDREDKRQREVDKRLTRKVEEHARLLKENQKKEDERQDEVDKLLKEGQMELKALVAKHSKQLEAKDVALKKQFEKLELQEHRLLKQEGEVKEQIEEIKKYIADLHGVEPEGEAQPAESTKRQKRPAK